MPALQDQSSTVLQQDKRTIQRVGCLKKKYDTLGRAGSPGDKGSTYKNLKGQSSVFLVASMDDDSRWYRNSLLPSKDSVGGERAEEKYCCRKERIASLLSFDELALFSCRRDGTGDNAKQQGRRAVALRCLVSLQTPKARTH